MGSVLADLKKIVSQRERCGIRSSIKHKGSGNRLIGYRGVLQLTETRRERFVFTGFKYMPDPPETIGVMAKLVRIGIAEERLILVYFADRTFERSLVFDPVAYERHGQEGAKKDTRKRRGERWRNLPRQMGAELVDYSQDRDEPSLEPPDTGEPEKGWFHV